MSEMIERVAEAIRKAGAEVGLGMEGGQAAVIARGAILAMRDPSDPMVQAGLSERDVNGCGTRGLPLVFAAMIDAALGGDDAEEA
jgi:hypothetical protein